MLALIVPAWTSGVTVICCCQCCWHHCQEHQDGNTFQCCLNHRHNHHDRQCRVELRSQAFLLHPGLLDLQVSPQAGVARVAGPAATAAWFPEAAGTTVVKRPELCALPSLLLLGYLGVQAQVPQTGGQDHGHHLCCPPVWPPLCIPIHPPSDVQVWISAASWCVWQRNFS